MQQAQVAGSDAAIPALWGLFPRAVLTMLRMPEVQSLHASAVEIYHENVFDLLAERAELSIGTTKPMGFQVLGKAEGGAWMSGGGDARAINGTHPAHCTCHACFKLQEQAKAQKDKDKAARLQAARDAALAKDAERRAARDGKASSSSSSASSAAAKVLKRGAGSPEGSSKASSNKASSNKASSNKASSSKAGLHKRQDDFATVGEKLTPLKSAAEVAVFARTIEATRTAKSHLLNDRSSRSHCLVKMHAAWGGGRTTTILFVDLAGSERIKRTGTEGEGKAEAMSINGSLTALGRVIKALGEQNAHVPYRDAALTMLLRDSFGGKSCTSVVINVAGEEEHAEETICSLKFGERMAIVRNSPTVVVDGDAMDPTQLQAVVEQVRRELAQLTADGQAGGFVEDAPEYEKRMLKENMAKLEEEERQLQDCIAQIAEARSSGASTASLQQRLRKLSSQAEIYRGVVEREQTIKKLWALPTPAYRRKDGELKQLEAQLMIALASPE